MFLMLLYEDTVNHAFYSPSLSCFDMLSKCLFRLSQKNLLYRLACIFQASQDLSLLKDIAEETGKKLTSLASNLFNDLQGRILWTMWFIRFLWIHFQRGASFIDTSSYQSHQGWLFLPGMAHSMTIWSCEAIAKYSILFFRKKIICLV